MSPKILAVTIIVAGILIVFFISGFQILTVFSPGITEEVIVSIKQNGLCIVEASDGYPRQIPNCPYKKGEQIVITYKPQQPSIDSHRPVQG